MKIAILPVKRELLVTIDENLLDALRKNGLDVLGHCNSVGICGQWRVKFEQSGATRDKGDQRIFELNP